MEHAPAWRGGGVVGYLMPQETSIVIGYLAPPPRTSRMRAHAGERAESGTGKQGRRGERHAARLGEVMASSIGPCVITEEVGVEDLAPMQTSTAAKDLASPLGTSHPRACVGRKRRRDSSRSGEK